MTYIAFTSFKFQTLILRLGHLSPYKIVSTISVQGAGEKAENDVKFIQITWIPVKILATYSHPGVGALP